jgi:transposase-like protein
VYRAVDQHGQVIDVYVSARRDIAAARRFFAAALAAHQEVLPAAFHDTDQYANNRVECDHGRLKARLRPMRGLKTERTAQVIVAGHALVQNICRGHYELGAESDPRLRMAAFGELRRVI